MTARIEYGYSALRFYAWHKDGCGWSESFDALTQALDAGKAHVCPTPSEGTP